MKSSYLKSSYSVVHSVAALVALTLPIFPTAHAQQPPVKPVPPVSAASAVRPASAASAPASAARPASAAASASSAPVFVAPQAKPMGDKPYLDTLEGTNTFDAQRKLWPDKRPPAPPPPPPPPPAPIADKDLQLYGVMIVGSVKRATVKVSSRFANLDAAGRGFISISEGQMLGDWQLTGIQPTHLVLTAMNGSSATQMLVFTKKTDRVAAPSPAPAPVPMQAPMPTALAPGNDGAPAPTTAAAPAPVNPAGGVPPLATAAANPAPVTPASVGANPFGANGQTNSLAAAIAAAQAAAQANPQQNQAQPTGAGFNPFLQLLKKQ